MRDKVRRPILLSFLLVAGSAGARTGPSSAPPLLPAAQGEAIAAEVSGARAMAGTLGLAGRPAWAGPSYGYEALNLVDGRRSVGEIRDVLTATLGPVPVEEVAEYLDVLARLGVLERVSG